MVADSEIDTAFNEEKKNIPEETFNKELAVRNLTSADMREALRRDLVSPEVLEQEVTAKVTVTNQDVNDFFQANKAQFNLPRGVLSHRARSSSRRGGTRA